MFFAQNQFDEEIFRAAKENDIPPFLLKNIFIKENIQRGHLGKIVRVHCSFCNDCVLQGEFDHELKWTVDPKWGAVGGFADIGTHALMQLRYVTGLEVAGLSAQLETFVQGRMLDDHFTIYCQLTKGAKALVRASQIAIGHKNDLGIEVAGTKGTLRWRQEEPESITVHLANQPDRVYGIGCFLAYFQFPVDHGLSCRSQHGDPLAALLFLKKGIELAQHGAAVADKSGIGLPVAAYQVSGEYAMIKAAAANGWQRLLPRRPTLFQGNEMRRHSIRINGGAWQPSATCH